MAKLKIKVPDVLKKDLKLLGYLLVFGLVTYLSDRYLVKGELAIVFGGVANYLLYRVERELKNEGYIKALKK